MMKRRNASPSGIATTKKGLALIVEELERERTAHVPPQTVKLTGGFDREFNKFDREFNKFDREFNKFDREGAAVAHPLRKAARKAALKRTRKRGPSSKSKTSK